MRRIIRDWWDAHVTAILREWLWKYQENDERAERIRQYALVRFRFELRLALQNGDLGDFSGEPFLWWQVQHRYARDLGVSLMRELQEQSLHEREVKALMRRVRMNAARLSGESRPQTVDENKERFQP